MPPAIGVPFVRLVGVDWGTWGGDALDDTGTTVLTAAAATVVNRCWAVGV